MRNNESMIAIDGGGTKTEFALFNSNGTILDTFRLTSTNPAVVGVENACSILCSGIERCINKCKDVRTIFAGLSGALGFEENIKKPIREQFGNINIDIENDAVNIISGANADIGVICGTGSIVITEDNGEYRYLGGWGNWIGDSGSGFNIGKEGIKFSLDMEEEIGEETVICSYLREELNVPPEERLVNYIFRARELGNAYIASLSKFVFKAYSLGDNVARKIVESEMEGIIKKVNKFAAENKKEKVLVVAAGGIFEHNKEALLPVAKKFALDKAEFVFPDLPPIYGACVACCKKAGIIIEKEFHSKFKQQYEKREDE